MAKKKKSQGFFRFRIKPFFWLSVFLFVASQVVVTVYKYEEVPPKLRFAYDQALKLRNSYLVYLPIDRYEAKEFVSNDAQNDMRIYFAPSKSILEGLLQMLDRAKSSIEVCVFELEHKKIVRKLIEKHEEGVRVRVVMDSNYLKNEELRELEDAGVELVGDNRSAFMHNKFVVVDKKHVWTGSMNFTYTGVGKNDNNALSLVSEELAENYLTEFEEMWQSSKRQIGFGIRSPRNTVHPRLSLANYDLITAFSPEDGVLKRLLREVSLSQKSIKIMAFAITSKDLSEALVAKQKSGVKVQVLVTRGAVSLRGSQFDYLKKNGIEMNISANRRGKMHHKVMIVDDQTVVTGSYNFSKAAEKTNDENTLIIKSKEVGKIYAREFSRCWRGVKGY